jgi:hypothetical protein
MNIIDMPFLALVSFATNSVEKHQLETRKSGNSQARWKDETIVKAEDER